MTPHRDVDPSTASEALATRSLIVVPTYNEASNIGQLVAEFFNAASDAHLVVVDDNSPDGTAKGVEHLMATYPNLSLIRRTGERALGHAYVAGILHGLNDGFEAIGTMDADLSHTPAYLPQMYAALSHCDVVIGSRYVRDGGTVNRPTSRVLLSWFANKFAATLLQLPARDITSGFRLYRRTSLEWIRTRPVKSTGYSFLAELLYRAHKRGARITEVPIIFHDRTLGVSKLHRREIYRGVLNLLKLRLSRD